MTRSMKHTCHWPGCDKEVPPSESNVPIKDTNPKDALGSMRAPLHMLPLPAIIQWALAHAEGGSKYGLWNWCAAGVRASIYVAAMIRHILKWFFGQECDPKTKVHHLGYVMACAAILIDAQWRGKLSDDRPPACPRIDELFAMAERIMPGLAALRTGVVKDWSIADIPAHDEGGAGESPHRATDLNSAGPNSVAEKAGALQTDPQLTDAARTFLQGI